MNPFPYIGRLFQWIGSRQSRETAIKAAELQLAQQQFRAEIFALTTTHDQAIRELESERDDLKAQVAAKDADLTDTRKRLKDAQDEIERLHKELDLYKQQAGKNRVDRKAMQMLFEIAKKKDGWTKNAICSYFFGQAIPQGEYFFDQLVQAKHVYKIRHDDKGVGVWGATEKGREVAFSIFRQ